MVCGRCGLAGNVRDSHIVAFLEKVMVVRDTSVLVTLACPTGSEFYQAKGSTNTS
jgi:hypothetical protein